MAIGYKGFYCFEWEKALASGHCWIRRLPSPIMRGSSANALATRTPAGIIAGLVLSGRRLRIASPGPSKLSCPTNTIRAAIMHATECAKPLCTVA